MNEKKKTSDLDITNPQEPSNTDPTHDTESQANPVQRKVTVGRQPILKEASHSNIESLRPSVEEFKNG